MLPHPSDFIDSLSYLGIFLLIFLLPAPQEIVLPLAGFMAAQGKLNLLGAVIAGVGGSAAGSLPWYWAGRYLGEERLIRWARQHRNWIKLPVQDIEKAKRWFDRFGSRAVLLSQCIPIVRTLIAVPAGMSRMNFGIFLLCLGLSAIVWQGLLAYAGYLLGGHYELINQYAGAFHIRVLVLSVVIIFWLIRRRR